ncbi:Maf family protein [Desulfobulbus oligotrophicus]|uniref:dTTP/UTP pyrophosphatase n=1 Tax=Desulfobulbus oligotrophicus TaxID=1909699 RepID=A0A7T5VF14_9BACT|nr:Maf family protein [Desulfobulbus oligotrophicus]QQG66703.1 septum formation inhibitor Maf [Desulfobulbus oligotrophicus]
MFIAAHPLILASGSPRRKDLLRQAGLTFQILPATVDELPHPSERPKDFAERMATEKTLQIAAIHPEACVLGADTVVTLDRRILGKPRDKTHALAMLKNLQGQTHTVITGFTLMMKNHAMFEAGTVATAVTFGTFTEPILESYVQTGEPMDKAGAYAIQGAGGFLIHKICGSYSNVVGLPMLPIIQILLKWNCIHPDQSPSHP